MISTLASEQKEINDVELIWDHRIFSANGRRRHRTVVFRRDTVLIESLLRTYKDIKKLGRL